MATQIVLQGILQNFDYKHNGRIYDENIYREHARKYEILMKMKNRMRKIENILSNLK
jgi:hypothetical protein